MNKNEWDKLWKQIKLIQDGFEPGVVFIGGVAVFAHIMESAYRDFFSFSHDADFVISLSDYTDLKDIEQVTPNRRLSKAQFYKGGFEFDVYVEGQNDLSVPYGEIAAHSEVKFGIRVACQAHLLVLKLKALESRGGSSKGEKDEDDVIRILLTMDEDDVSPHLMARLDDNMVLNLERIVRSDASVRLTSGNLHRASELRRIVVETLQQIIHLKNRAPTP